MMKFILLAIFIALELSLVHSINWQPGNWAMGCDFNVEGNNLAQKNGPGKDCSSNCQFKYGCTHFVHVGGVCYMKKGSVSKNDAIDTGDQKFVCGIIKESSGSGPRPQPGPQPGTPITGSWPGCQFKFGIAWNKDISNDMLSKFDYLTKWIGPPSSGCTGSPRCTDFNDGDVGAFYRKAKQLNKPIVLYAYIIAFEVKSTWGVEDCNVKIPGKSTLCKKGADFVRSHRQQILDRFKMNAQKVAEIYGTANPTTFLINPDLWQYHDGGDGDKQDNGGLTFQQLGSLFEDIVNSIKAGLPNAKISWDISPWIDENTMRNYWNAFSNSHSKIDFINTSGGVHYADSQTIQRGHGLSWEFMNRLTGKKIIADCGYGVNGKEENNCNGWQNPTERIRNGVAMITAANAEKFGFSPGSRANTC